MSLKIFHIVFVLTALGFLLFFTYWSGIRYMRDGGGLNLALAGASGLAFAVGVPYLVWFIRKSKSLP